MLSYHYSQLRRHYLLKAWRRFHCSKHRLLLAVIAFTAIIVAVLTIGIRPLVHRGNSASNWSWNGHSDSDIENGIQPTDVLPLSLPPLMDSDRPVTVRRHYEDALTVIADHASVYAPIALPRFAVSRTAASDWSSSNNDFRSTIAHTQSLLVAVNDSARVTVLQSLLKLQLSDTVCDARGRYLLYDWHTEFALVNTACQSKSEQSKAFASSHKNSNKVQSHREIAEQLEKAKKRKEKSKLKKDVKPMTSDELSEQCRVSQLTDLVRALAVAQASQRQLVLVPPHSRYCDDTHTDSGRSVGMTASLWLGCHYHLLLTSPSSCPYSAVRSLIDRYGYHEDPYYDGSDTPLALYQSVQHCAVDDRVFANTSGMGRLAYYQILTRFLLSPTSLLASQVERTVQSLLLTSDKVIGVYTSGQSLMTVSDDSGNVSVDPTALASTVSTISDATVIHGISRALIWHDSTTDTLLLSVLRKHMPRLQFQLLTASVNGVSPDRGAAAGYLGSLTKLLVFANVSSLILTHSYESPVSLLVTQLTQSHYHRHLGVPMIDIGGDEWYYDCSMFSYHFYRAHTSDRPLLAHSTGIHHYIQSLSQSQTSGRVKLLVLVGVSNREIESLQTMLDRTQCNGTILAANNALSDLLQRLFHSPQTVDDYVNTRVKIVDTLGNAVNAVLADTGTDTNTVIRVDFKPWDIDRPFRSVLKPDVSMLARFIVDLQSFLPIDLKLLIATREPASMVYAGTQSSIQSLPSGLPIEWRFFFVARVLHDHFTALTAELRSMASIAFHVVDMDDLLINTAYHSLSLAEFLGQSTSCARRYDEWLRLTDTNTTKLVSVIDEPPMTDLTINEAAGAYDILNNLHHHRLFSHSQASIYLWEALRDHQSVKALIANDTGVAKMFQRDDFDTVLSRFDFTAPSPPPSLASTSASSAAVADDVRPVQAALVSSTASAIIKCDSSNFLVFDRFVRAVPCQCGMETLSSTGRNDPYDEPPVAEAIRAVARAQSLALSTGRSLLLPLLPNIATTAPHLAFLQQLSQWLQPLSPCTVRDAEVSLECNCQSLTYALTNASASAVVGTIDRAGDSTVRTVVGDSDDFDFRWLIQFNKHRKQIISAYEYVSEIALYLMDRAMASPTMVQAQAKATAGPLQSSQGWSWRALTLAFTLPRSDLYTVDTYVRLIDRQLTLYGIHQLYLTVSCSALYQHQRDDSEAGSRAPSCQSLYETIRAIQQRFVNDSSRRELLVYLSPWITTVFDSTRVVNATSFDDRTPTALMDMWHVSQSSHIITTLASEEGLLTAEFAYRQSLVYSHSQQVYQPPVYDVFGHSWLDGMIASTTQSLTEYFERSVIVHSPAVTKTVFSDSVRFIFIAGIEGAGHHFFESVLGGTLVYSPWNPYGHANVTRVKTVEQDVTFYEDLLPNVGDVLGDGGRIDGAERSASASPGTLSSPHYHLDLPLTRIVYEIFTHDSVDAYIDARHRIIERLKIIVAKHSAAPIMADGVPYHPKRLPVIFPLNHLGAAYGMHSYPNMFGADKMMHHPYLATLANIMEEAGADFRIVTAVRSPEACHWSTVRRHHGEEVGSHNSYMFQARGLHDNLAYLDEDMRALDPRFVLQLHLTDVTRDPYRYASAIAGHVGLEASSLQSSLLSLSHQFTVQPDGAWRSALNWTQMIAMRDHFDFAPLLTIFKHRYDSLKQQHWSSTGAEQHLCLPPHTLTRVSKLVRQDGGSGGAVKPVTLVSLEGSGDSLLRWMIEQSSGKFTGSVHGDKTPGSKSDTVPRVVNGMMGTLTQHGRVALVSQRHCAFHCSDFQSSQYPIIDYQPVSWTARLAPKNKEEREAEAVKDVDRRNRERVKVIVEMEGEGARDKYPLPAANQRQPKAVIDAVTHRDGDGDNDNGYVGDSDHDLIILYRNPIDVAINLASMTLTNHFLYSEPSRLTLNPIWSRWWKNSLTKQAQSLLVSLIEDVAYHSKRFLATFPYQRYRTQRANQRVLYVRYEDLMLHTDIVLPTVLDFIGADPHSDRSVQCVVDRVAALQTGVSASVCHHITTVNNQSVIVNDCGVASDSMEDFTMSAVHRGHSRGLRHLTGAIEQSTNNYPFKWTDLIEGDVWDAVQLQLNSSVVSEMLASLGFSDSIASIDRYVRTAIKARLPSDPLPVTAKAMKKRKNPLTNYNLGSH